MITQVEAWRVTCGFSDQHAGTCFSFLLFDRSDGHVDVVPLTRERGWFVPHDDEDDVTILCPRHRGSA